MNELYLAKDIRMDLCSVRYVGRSQDRKSIHEGKLVGT